MLASVTLAGVAWTSACGDGATEPAPPEPPRATTVAVTPATAELSALGATVQLSSQVLDQYGQTMAGAAVAWASGNATIATVDGSGLVTAVQNGTVTITATSGSASGSALVTVAQLPDSVAVVPSEAKITALGDTLRLEAEALDANGHPVPGTEFTWTSSDGAVAAVDGSGLVTAVQDGTATVTAASGPARGRAAVTVAQSPDSVAVIPSEATITALGITLRLESEAFDANGHPVPRAEFAWESSNDAVATVDGSGLVTAVRNGTVTMTATSGPASGSAAVTVAQSPDSVAVVPSEATITALGDTLRLAPEAFDANGHPVANAEFSWESSDVAVATVDGSGVVTAAGNGTATITATAGAASGAAMVTVAQVPDSVAVVPAEATIAALGDTLRLEAEAFDANGHAVADAALSWKSSDDAVATVDGSGLVTAAGNGTATITATAGAASGAAAVTVVPPSTLSGTVTDGRKAGLGVPGATVWLGNGRNESTTTDVHGRYRFSNISGRVKITVSARPSYRDQTAEVTVGSVPTLDFTLEHTGIPPFTGTAWVTSDVLGPSDPTSLGSVTYAGRGIREIFDRRANAWITVNTYLFDVQFGDRTVEWQFNPEFGSREAARAQITVFAPAIGRLPAVLLSNLREVEVNAGQGAFGGNGHNGSLLIHTEDPGTVYAVREGFLEEVFLHEGAHVSLDMEHYDSPGWRAAQQADGVSISEYGRDFPDREDIAESILPYFAVRYRPERLTASVRWLMMMTIPNRLAYFDEQELDMSPYTVQSSFVVTAPIAFKLPAQQETHWYGDLPIPPRRKRR